MSTMTDQRLDFHTYPYRFEEVTLPPEPDSVTKILGKMDDLHTVLRHIDKALNAPVLEEVTDQRFVQTLFKTGIGGNWIPSRFGRLYIYVAAPVATAMSVTSVLGPPFVLTIPSATLPNYWNLLDLPDQTSIMLDSTATANQMSIHVLITNKKM